LVLEIKKKPVAMGTFYDMQGGAHKPMFLEAQGFR
jgi:hypothetical protein